MKWLAVVAALVPGLCSAEVPWFLGAGLGIAEREDSEPPFENLDFAYEDGIVYHVEGSVRLEPNVLLRGTYAYTNYDELTAVGFLVISENVAQRELRLGAFYAPRPLAWLGFRVGGGYATFGDTMEGTSHGYFGEAAAVLHTGTHLSWDLSAARQVLDSEDDRDGTDWRLAGTFSTEVFCVTLAARRLELAPADELVDYRFTVGRSWGGPR